VRSDSESDKPTKTLERDRLLDLLEESSGPKELAHTVAREQLASRKNTAKVFVVPAPEEIVDADISKALSPAVVFGVIAMVIGLFIALMQAS